MSKKKIIGLLLGTLLLTSCGNGENAAETAETEGNISETAGNISETSEIISETRETVSETAVSETEIPETSETTAQEETENTENFDKVKDRVIYDDGKNSLTAGQLIDALESCEEFAYWFDRYYAFQIMDIDENGIPEILIYRDIAPHMSSILYSVAADGKAEAVRLITHDFCSNYKHDECYELIGGSLTPYKKDGETLWIGYWRGSGTGGGSSGTYILNYDGSGIDGEVIEKAAYETGYIGNDENGDMIWYWNDYYYIFGEDVTEEEYDKRRDEYMNSLKPSDELYVESSYDDRITEYEFREKLSYALNNYLDMRDGA